MSDEREYLLRLANEIDKDMRLTDDEGNPFNAAELREKIISFSKAGWREYWREHNKRMKLVVTPPNPDVQAARERLLASEQLEEFEDWDSHFRDVRTVCAALAPEPQRWMAKQLGNVVLTLDWALDLLAMYDERLVQLGDPAEFVYSAIQIRGRREAGELLDALRSQPADPAPRIAEADEHEAKA